jgi:hypothetical protein
MEGAQRNYVYFSTLAAATLIILFLEMLKILFLKKNLLRKKRGIFKIINEIVPLSFSPKWIFKINQLFNRNVSKLPRYCYGTLDQF